MPSSEPGTGTRVQITDTRYRYPGTRAFVPEDYGYWYLVLLLQLGTRYDTHYYQVPVPGTEIITMVLLLGTRYRRTGDCTATQL